MAVLQGGIFSRPRGKVGGVVFGAARTRQGKLVTSRLLVPPSNPNTTAQQEQRSIFSSAMAIVRRIGSAIYRLHFNRSVGQLPGFQSMQSIFMNQMNSALELVLVNSINLGILHNPLTFTIAKETTTGFIAEWSDELGDNGTSADKVYFLAIAKDSVSRALPGGVVVWQDSPRENMSTSVTGLVASATYEVYAYLVGEGTASGLMSVAQPFEVDLSAS